MPLNPEMRASDADRDRVAAALREHCAQGRLTVDELNERLEATYTARTLGELERVTHDLPEEDLDYRPIAAHQRASTMPAKRGGLYRTGLRTAWATYTTVNLICFTIWLIVAATGGSAYPWFLWVAGPWGAVLLAGQVLGPKGGRPRT
ncbi:MAG TPA: DUF1707 domain-containing protein [Streptosporangiaceae bacterium]